MPIVDCIIGQVALMNANQVMLNRRHWLGAIWHWTVSTLNIPLLTVPFMLSNHLFLRSAECAVFVPALYLRYLFNNLLQVKTPFLCESSSAHWANPVSGLIFGHHLLSTLPAQSMLIFTDKNWRIQEGLCADWAFHRIPQLPYPAWQLACHFNQKVLAKPSKPCN